MGGLMKHFNLVIITALFNSIVGNDTIFGFEEKEVITCDSGHPRLTCSFSDVIVVTEVRHYYNNATCPGSEWKCCANTKNDNFCFTKGNRSVVSNLQDECDMTKSTKGHCTLPPKAPGNLAVNYICWNHTDTRTSCKDKCGEFDKDRACQCNSKCIRHQNCCPDYVHQCNATCSGRCFEKYEYSEHLCPCDANCTEFNNCCPDYKELCQDGCLGDCPSECASDHLVPENSGPVSPASRINNAVIVGLVVACIIIVVVVIVLIGLVVRRKGSPKQRAFQRRPIPSETDSTAVQTREPRAVTYADIVFESDEGDVIGDDVMSVQYASVHKPRREVPTDTACLQTYDHIPERTSDFTAAPNVHYNTLQESGWAEVTREEWRPTDAVESEYDRLNRWQPGNKFNINKPPGVDEYDSLNRNVHADGDADVQADRVAVIPYSDDTGSGYEYAQVIPYT